MVYRYTMTFHKISALCGGLFLLLSALLMFFPEIIYWLFGLDQNDLGDFMGKRAAMLFIGFSALCWLSRRTQDIAVQRVVSAAICISMAGMALIGIYEFLRGFAGIGIWFAIITEIAISALSFRTWRIAKHSAMPKK